MRKISLFFFLPYLELWLYKTTCIGSKWRASKNMNSFVFTPKNFCCFEGNVGNMAVTCKCPHCQRANMCHLVSENYSVQTSPWAGGVGGGGGGLWRTQGLIYGINSVVFLQLFSPVCLSIKVDIFYLYHILE